ncbi:hypothetical protein F4677DRAFT_326258 [Hypoxylon crocopeplum]|nr:hypothetical protein F4677DRAFT_326258 [Hypoxylon crocopeplum]
MTRTKGARKRRTGQQGSQSASKYSTDIPAPDNQRSPSHCGDQLASPPASSEPVMRSNSPACRHDSNAALSSTENGEGDTTLQSVVNVDEEPVEATTSSSSMITPPSLSRPKTRRLSVPECDTPASSKHLSTDEKIKLLKIGYNHRTRLLHCPTSGKHAEEEVWTSVMEEFSTTVRAGVFEYYAQVKKVINKISNNRRKKTKGTARPERRAHMGDLDMWINLWLGIWKCRSLVINIAGFHSSLRETLGEKKLKRIYRHRLDGTKLPEELGVLTLSPLLWKEIQKVIRAVERPFRSRSRSMFLSEDESDSSEEQEDAATEAVAGALPLQSIEEECQHGLSPATPQDLTSRASLEAEREPELSGSTPHTQVLLQQFEQGAIAQLRAEAEKRPGERVTLLSLAQGRLHQQRQPSLASSSTSQAPFRETIQPQRRSDLKGPESHMLASHSNDIGEKEGNDYPATFLAETSGLERPPRKEANMQRSAGTSFSRSQRFQPGTYAAGESVPVGWHARQIPLAGSNTTVERDYRQTVFASISPQGQINFRLRAHNMRGTPVPLAYRLKGVTSVSHKDIIYYPRFEGMPYDEIREEIASQTLDPVDQRVADPSMPMPGSETSNTNNIEPVFVLRPRNHLSGGLDAAPEEASIKSRTEKGEQNTAAASVSQARNSDVSTGEHNVRNDSGVDVIQHVSVAVERRDPVLSEPSRRQPPLEPFLEGSNGEPALPIRKSKEATSNRAGTPAQLRKFLEDEARKLQRPLAPVSVPSRSSPSWKPSPNVPRPSDKSRITPSRFYGNRSSELNAVVNGQPLQQQISELPTPNPSKTPTTLPQRKPEDDRTTGRHSNHSLPLLSSFYTPMAFSLVREQSDDESLPDVEELHRRSLAVAKLPDNSLREGDRSSPQTDTRARDLEDGPGPLEEVNTNCRKLKDEESEAQRDANTNSSASRRKTHSRRRSTVNLSGIPGINSLKRNAAPESPEEVCPTDDSHLAKRQKHSPYPEPTPKTGSNHDGAQRLVSDPPAAFCAPGLNNSGSAPGPNVPDRGEPSRQLGSSSGSSANKGKGRATQPGDGDGYSHPTIGGRNSLKWENKKSKATSTHRYSPHDQPSGSTQPKMQGRHRPNLRTQTAGPAISSLIENTRMATSSASSATPRQRRKSRGWKRGRRRGRRRERDRHDQGNHNNNKNNNRFVRETTTATVDFQDFCLDKKCDFLLRKLSRMEERINKYGPFPV